MIRYLTLIALLVLAVVVGVEAFEWTVNRVYVPEGKSLQLRYKGPLFLNWGQKYAKPGEFANEKEGEFGVLEQLRGPGRHFYCPIWWERKIVDDVVVRPGEIAVLNSMMGEERADRSNG